MVARVNETAAGAVAGHEYDHLGREDLLDVVARLKDRLVELEGEVESLTVELAAAEGLVAVYRERARQDREQACPLTLGQLGCRGRA